MLVIHQDGRYRYVNKTMCERLGWTFEEMTSPSFDVMEKIIPQRFCDLVSENIAKRLRGEHVPPFYICLKTRDGSEIPVIASARLITYQGKPAIEGILLDISAMEQLKTRLQEAEDKLRIEREKAQKYLDIVEVIVLALDTHGRIQLLNRKGCEILGCRPEEVLGKDWIETFVPERFHGRFKEILQSLMAGEDERFNRFEAPVMTRRGEERVIQWHNSILRDENGRAIGIICSGLDVTERKTVEERLRELAYKLNGLRSGGCFVSDSAERCFKAFADLTLHGVPGFCIAREDPERLINEYGPTFKNLVLLSSRPIKGFKAVSTLQDVSLAISEFLKTNTMAVVLLDGVEYLIAKNGFEPFYRFIQEKRFDFLEKNALLLIHLNLDTLTERERALLLSEIEILR